MQMNLSECFVGIDVSKAQLDVSVLPQETFWSSANDDAGRADVVARLREMAPTLIVLGKGGKERMVLLSGAADLRLPKIRLLRPLPRLSRCGPTQTPHLFHLQVFLESLKIS